MCFQRCLEWDPKKRMTPDEAIKHAWILEGLPAKVLIHHQKLHGIRTKELPDHIRELRTQYLLEQPDEIQKEFSSTPEDDVGDHKEK